MNVANEKIMPDSELEARYERYKGVIKNFTERMPGICSAGHYGKTGSASN